MKTLLNVSMCLVLGSNLYGVCKEKDIIFFCSTKKGKIIEVCDKKSTIEYSFGKSTGKKDLTLNVPRDTVTTHQWDGMGPMYFTVNIPNKNTVYSVYFSMDRMSEEHNVDAGVEVITDGKSVATVQCSDKVVNNMEGVDLPAEQQ